MPRSSNLALATALVLSVSGCAANGAGGTADPLMDIDRTTVEVTNNNWSDVRVFIVHGGSRIRLGTVSAMGRQVFQLPRTMSYATGNVRLVADPIGSRNAHFTAPITLSSGQRISFRVENHLAISTVSVFD